jgi:ArsR family transcriptional regulator
VNHRAQSEPCDRTKDGEGEHGRSLSRSRAHGASLVITRRTCFLVPVRSITCTIVQLFESARELPLASTREKARESPRERATVTVGDHSHDAPAPRTTAGETALARAAGIFRAAGEPARLRLLELLSQGELCVTEVAALTGEELSTISQRLRVLRAEHLVSRRRDGKHIFYALADEHVADLIRAVLAHASEDGAHKAHNHHDHDDHSE